MGRGVEQAVDRRQHFNQTAVWDIRKPFGRRGSIDSALLSLRLVALHEGRRDVAQGELEVRARDQLEEDHEGQREGS